MTGFVPCFSNQADITSTSKMVPLAVQTGCLKGCSDAAQKLKGSRLKDAPFGPLSRTFEPELALNASVEDHSE